MSIAILKVLMLEEIQKVLRPAGIEPGLKKA